MSRYHTHARAHLRSRTLVVAVLTLAFCLSWTVSRADAASLNQQSDQTALRAYESYLNALVTDVPTAEAQDKSFVTTVDRLCPNALSDDTLGTDVQSNIGVEMGGDLTLDYLSPEHKPFDRFAVKLSALTWSTPSAITTVEDFVGAESTLLALKPTTPTNLCGDVAVLGSNSTQTPPTTTSFDKRYETAATPLAARVDKLLALFERYETKADRTAVKKIDSLANRYGELTTSIVNESCTNLEKDLGAAQQPCVQAS